MLHQPPSLSTLSDGCDILDDVFGPFVIILPRPILAARFPVNKNADGNIIPIHNGQLDELVKGLDVQ